LIVLAWNWSDIIAGGGASYLGGIIDYFQDLTLKGGKNIFGLLKLNHSSAGQVKIIIQANYNGPIGSATVTPLVNSPLAKHGVANVVAARGAIVGHPVSAPSSQAYVDYRWWQVVQDLNGSGDNQKEKYKSAYMRAGFPKSQIQTIYKYLRAAGPAAWRVACLRKEMRIHPVYRILIRYLGYRSEWHRARQSLTRCGDRRLGVSAPLTRAA